MLAQERTESDLKSCSTDLSADEMKAKCAAALAVEAARRGLEVVRDALHEVEEAAKASDAETQRLVRRCESEMQRAR